MAASRKQVQRGRGRLKRLQIFVGSMGSVMRRFTAGRSRFGGMEVSDARRLKALEEENRKLKKLATQMRQAPQSACPEGAPPGFFFPP
jgi:hypothetical protein